jgi:hypothetical protein
MAFNADINIIATIELGHIDGVEWDEEAQMLVIVSSFPMTLDNALNVPDPRKLIESDITARIKFRKYTCEIHDKGVNIP